MELQLNYQVLLTSVKEYVAAVDGGDKDEIAYAYSVLVSRIPVEKKVLPDLTFAAIADLVPPEYREQVYKISAAAEKALSATAALTKAVAEGKDEALKEVAASVDVLLEAKEQAEKVEAAAVEEVKS